MISIYKFLKLYYFAKGDGYIGKIIYENKKIAILKVKAMVTSREDKGNIIRKGCTPGGGEEHSPGVGSPFFDCLTLLHTEKTDCIDID